MKRTRWITEGAALLAIFIILLLVSLYVPILGIVALLAQPIPFIVFAYRHESTQAIVFVFVATLLSFMFTVPLTVVNVAFAGIAGVLLGLLYKKQRSNMEIISLVTFVYLINFVVLYWVSIGLLEVNIVQQMEEQLVSGMQIAEKIIKQANIKIDEKQLAALKEMPSLVKKLLPSLFVMMSVFTTFLTIVVAHPVLKRLRFSIPSWPPLRDIQIPKSILWYYMIVIFIPLFVKTPEDSFATMVILNFQIVFSLLFVLQGFSLFAFFSYKKGYHKAMPLILLILVFILPFLFSIVMFLGIIDVSISLRGRFIKRG